MAPTTAAIAAHCVEAHLRSAGSVGAAVGAYLLGGTASLVAAARLAEQGTGAQFDVPEGAEPPEFFDVVSGVYQQRILVDSTAVSSSDAAASDSEMDIDELMGELRQREQHARERARKRRLQRVEDPLLPAPAKRAMQSEAPEVGAPHFHRARLGAGISPTPSQLFGKMLLQALAKQPPTHSRFPRRDALETLAVYLETGDAEAVPPYLTPLVQILDLQRKFHGSYERPQHIQLTTNMLHTSQVLKPLSDALFELNAALRLSRDDLEAMRLTHDATHIPYTSYQAFLDSVKLASYMRSRNLGTLPERLQSLALRFDHKVKMSDKSQQRKARARREKAIDKRTYDRVAQVMADHPLVRYAGHDMRKVSIMLGPTLFVSPFEVMPSAKSTHTGQAHPEMKAAFADPSTGLAAKMRQMVQDRKNRYMEYVESGALKRDLDLLLEQYVRDRNRLSHATKREPYTPVDGEWRVKELPTRDGIWGASVRVARMAAEHRHRYGPLREKKNQVIAAGKKEAMIDMYAANSDIALVDGARLNVAWAFKEHAPVPLADLPAPPLAELGVDPSFVCCAQAAMAPHNGRRVTVQVWGPVVAWSPTPLPTADRLALLFDGRAWSRVKGDVLSSCPVTSVAAEAPLLDSARVAGVKLGRAMKKAVPSFVSGAEGRLANVIHYHTRLENNKVGDNYVVFSPHEDTVTHFVLPRRNAALYPTLKAYTTSTRVIASPGASLLFYLSQRAVSIEHASVLARVEAVTKLKPLPPEGKLKPGAQFLISRARHGVVAGQCAVAFGAAGATIARLQPGVRPPALDMELEAAFRHSSTATRLSSLVVDTNEYMQGMVAGHFAEEKMLYVSGGVARTVQLLDPSTFDVEGQPVLLDLKSGFFSDVRMAEGVASRDLTLLFMVHERDQRAFVWDLTLPRVDDVDPGPVMVLGPDTMSHFRTQDIAAIELDTVARTLSMPRKDGSVTLLIVPTQPAQPKEQPVPYELPVLGPKDEAPDLPGLSYELPELPELPPAEDMFAQMQFESEYDQQLAEEFRQFYE